MQETARPHDILAVTPPEISTSPELSIVVPTLNENDNVPRLVSQLARALGSVRWEVIFVDDDSVDGTAATARRLARRDPRVRCMRRIGRRGLAGACIEGMLAASAPAIVVMDGDLQHDETCLPQMLQHFRRGADLVVATRRTQAGVVTGGFSAVRQWGSRWATVLARRLTGVTVTDPMSGFFLIRQDAFEAIAPRLSTQGFKLLLDIMASQQVPLVVREVPYSFRPRQYGESKLDSMVVLEYSGLLLAKLTGDLLSTRFLLFMLVGASGLIVHLVALQAALSLFGFAFDVAQTCAAYLAMTWNFFVNNLFTYRDRRLRGTAVVKGLVSFYVVCSVGAVANIGVANWIYGGRPTWWLAGTAGALMGAVFNYAASSTFTWRQR
ncbi:MAG TPA: glycosyltransferase family 2 protein [Hyphomicrobiaceae bacterium]|nr:glycosyltransferase family 2 protein [Hyphomicrobiaceae bacterium]